MKIKEESYDVGVIVGRFQVHELHSAHHDLIKSVTDKHKKVLLFLGLSPLMNTQENPLDFESRKQMLLERFPEVNVLYIKDVNNDEVWSKKLDEMIGDIVSPSQTVVLYGGRDSFLSHYKGKLPTKELVQDRWVSGSEIRKTISKKVKSSPDFRAGVIWASANQFPKAYTTVDVAIYDDHGRILLARKPNEELFRLVGGFSTPDSESFEQDARREVQEETGVAISDPVYIGSYKINDWRYRKEVDKIKTILFKAKYTFGAPRANDDICEVRWFDMTKTNTSMLVEEHRKLYQVAVDSISYDLTEVFAKAANGLR